MDANDQSESNLGGLVILAAIKKYKLKQKIINIIHITLNN